MGLLSGAGSVCYISITRSSWCDFWLGRVVLKAGGDALPGGCVAQAELGAMGGRTPQTLSASVHQQSQHRGYFPFQVGKQTSELCSRAAGLRAFAGTSRVKVSLPPWV